MGETAGGMMSTLIKRNTVLPVKRSMMCSTTRDNQSAMSIQVFEGEMATVSDNHFLGGLAFTGIPRAPRGQPQIEVTLEVDVDGNLNVSAVDKATGQGVMVSITRGSEGRLSEEQIEKMIQDEWVISRSALESYMSFVRAAVEGSSKSTGVSIRLEAKEKEVVMEALEQCQSWLDSGSGSDSESIKVKHHDLEGICAPILSRHYSKHMADHSSEAGDVGESDEEALLEL